MKDAAALHKEEYDVAPQLVAVAPGIVHLFGEHTELTGGFAMSFALNRGVSFAVSQRRDNSLRFFAADYNERKRTSISNIKYKREDRWANYLKGVINGFLGAGYNMKGLDITLTGDLPPGIGLGSSAALTAAAACGIKNLLGLSFAERDLINLALRAETHFMGIQTGAIETFASFLCRKKQAIFMDTSRFEYRYVPLNMKGTKFLVTDSQIPRMGGAEDLSLQKEDYQKSLELLGKRRPGISLKDYSPKDIRESIGVLPEHLRRRCLHVVEENVRAREAEEILRSRGSMVNLGKLLTRSHESLRDLLEVSYPEFDWLVKRSAETEGVYGSRLTGAGYGRCTITMIREDAIPEYEKRLEEYERIFGFGASVFVCEPSEGVKLL